MDRQRTPALAGVLAMAGFLAISAMIAFVATGGDRATAVRYLAAPVCAPAAGLDAAECRYQGSAVVRSLVVESDGAAVSLEVHDHAVAQVVVAHVVGAVSPVTTGDTVAIIGWNGTIAQIADSGTVLHTDDEPTERAHRGVFMVVALGFLAAILMMVGVTPLLAGRPRYSGAVGDHPGLSLREGTDLRPNAARQAPTTAPPAESPHTNAVA